MSPLYAKDQDRSQRVDELESLNREVLNIIHALTLGTQNSVYKHLSFSRFEREELNILQRGSAYSFSSIDYLPGNSRYNVNFDWKEIESIFDKLTAAEGIFYEDLKIIIDRFMKAKNIIDIKQIALELCIIFEFIFIGDERGRISYKVSNRIAEFLGGSPEEISNVKSILIRIYDIRDTFVHGNKRNVDEISVSLFDGSIVDVGEIISQGLEITRKLTLKILEINKFPAPVGKT